GRTNVAEPEDRGAVGDHRDQIAAGRVHVGKLLVLGDFQAGFGNPRAVRQGELARRAARLGGNDLHLPLAPGRMVGERFLAPDLALAAAVEAGSHGRAYVLAPRSPSRHVASNDSLPMTAVAERRSWERLVARLPAPFPFPVPIPGGWLENEVT